MEQRPRITLILSTLDKFLERSALLLFLFLWGFTFFAFFNLPETIPIHFNSSGDADRHGSKMTLLILPFIAGILYVCITQLNKHPHIFNYATKITEANALQQYTAATRMFRYIKFAVIIIFSAIVYATYQIGVGEADALGPWFFPLLITVSMVGAAVSIWQFARKPKNDQRRS